MGGALGGETAEEDAPSAFAGSARRRCGGGSATTIATSPGRLAMREPGRACPRHGARESAVRYCDADVVAIISTVWRKG